MHELPTEIELLDQLTGLFQSQDQLDRIISRKGFVEQGTFPVEVVTIQLKDGRTLDLFCKYLGSGGANNFGHRGGVSYEARVYEEVIAKIPLAHTRYFGTCIFGENVGLAIILEFLGKTLRFGYSTDPNALSKAAAWIGAFHRLTESSIPSFLTVYTRDYYDHWRDQFADLSKPFFSEFPDLEKLIRVYDRYVGLLLDSPVTIVHGEYYTRNVLIKEGIIYPVDWESAALAAGEIDFASLTEQWPQEYIDPARKAYVNARWPGGDFSLDDFEMRFLVAQIYLYMRWCPFRLEKDTWIKNDRVRNYMEFILRKCDTLFGE
jgi:thiamine kinase-like enzyme